MNRRDGSFVIFLAVTTSSRVATEGGVASLEGAMTLLAQVDSTVLALDLVGRPTAR